MHAELTQCEEIEVMDHDLKQMEGLYTNLDLHGEFDKDSWVRLKPSNDNLSELELKKLFE